MILPRELWKKWMTEGVDNITKTYSPPQLQPGYFPNICNRIDFITHNSKCCNYCPLTSQARLFDLTRDGDIFLNKLLENESEKCPEYLRGVWWMQDNVVNERFVTFGDADWKTDKYAIKHMKYNWTNDNTCQGKVHSCILATFPLNLEIEISNDNKWIAIRSISTKGWMGRIDEDVKYSNEWWEPQLRNTIGVSKEDLYRLTYAEFTNSKSRLKYQYGMKRVAYLDKNGTLVKTEAWNEYLRRCNLTNDKNIFKPENREQIVRFKMDR